MEVAKRGKEFRHLSKVTVDVDLFEVGLREAFRIAFVILVRPAEQFLIAASYDLCLDDGPT